MLDIKFIRENPQLIKKILIDKWVKLDLDEFLKIDDQRKKLSFELDELNALKKQIAKEQNQEKWVQIKQKTQDLEKQLNEINQKFNKILYEFPNIPSEDTPVWKDDSENVVVRKIWELPKFNFEPKDHVEICEKLNLINIQKAGFISGSRFAYIMNDLVKLQFWLIQYAFDVLTNETILKQIIEQNKLKIESTPFIPVLPPVFIKYEIMEKMARLHPMDERYCFPEDGQCLVWSAEHTLWPIHMNEIIDEHNFPIRYVWYSTSFRREAGSYWKDVKWILRMHQFDKVEMESFCLPEKSIEEQNFMVAIQEYLMKSLGLAFQTVICCTWDQWWPDARHLDIETRMPWQNRYRETHSADLMTDFQARRLNTKFKKKNWEKWFVHINDATVFAMSRTLIAIIENYQQKDWTIVVPQILRRYFDKEVIC